MQASRINLNSEYAANYQGREVAIRVTEMRTTRSLQGTTNHVIGYLADDEGLGKGPKVAIEVKDVIDDLDKHQALAAEKNRQAAERNAKEEARKAYQKHAVQLLAEAIGAQTVNYKYPGRTEPKWNQDAPAVIVDGHGIELNEEAIPVLITFLKKVGIQLPVKEREDVS